MVGKNDKHIEKCKRPCFLDRGVERERREKHQYVAFSQVPQPGPGIKPTMRTCIPTGLGIESSTIQCMGCCSYQMSYTGQSCNLIFTPLLLPSGTQPHTQCLNSYHWFRYPLVLYCHLIDFLEFIFSIRLEVFEDWNRSNKKPNTQQILVNIFKT